MSQILDIFWVLTLSDSSKLICPWENAGTEGHIKSIRLVSMGQRGVTMVTQDHTYCYIPEQPTAWPLVHQRGSASDKAVWQVRMHLRWTWKRRTRGEGLSRGQTIGHKLAFGVETHYCWWTLKLCLSRFYHRGTEEVVMMWRSEKDKNAAEHFSARARALVFIGIDSNCSGIAFIPAYYV